MLYFLSFSLLELLHLVVDLRLSYVCLFRPFCNSPKMSDSDQWNSDEETSGPTLSGMNMNLIKERFGSQPNAVSGGSECKEPTSETNRSASSFWDQTDNNKNNYAERSSSSGGTGWTTDSRRGDRNGQGGGTCYNCKESGHMARECPQPRKPLVCHTCNEEGHTSRNCTSADGNSQGFQGGRGGGSNNSRGFGGNRGGDRVCYKCQQPGHMANNCTNEEQSSNKDGSSTSYKWNESNGNSYSGEKSYNQNNRQDRQGGSRGCYTCGEDGHISRDCPSGGGGGGGGYGSGSNNRNNDDGSKPRGCFTCGDVGHISRDCTSGGGFGGSNNRNNDEGSRPKGCFKCKEEGHRASECTNEPVGDNSRSGGKSGCFKCGDSTHMAKDCTKTDEELKSMGIEVKPAPVTYVPVEIDDNDLFGQGVAAGNNFSAYSNIPVKVSGKDVPKAISSFAASELRKILLENVERAHYNVPTPIQKTAIPIIMNGRDIMGCAQTGSGKTAAYLLPILHYILEKSIESFAYENPMKLTALILAPTRELAIQIYNEARKFAAGSTLKICITYGGVSVSHQHKKFQEGCHVLVATPGRLMDFVNKDRLTFSELKFLVLDEADRMLDLGFSEDVKKIIAHSSTPSKEERQTLMFSATFSEEVQNLAKDFLNNYVFVVIGIVGAANADVKQSILEIEAKDKRETLHSFLTDILHKNEKEKILVFVATKRMADFLAAFLSQQEISTTSIHGDRFQNQREEALTEFKNGIRNVLIATAVAARGLDIKGVGYVINVDLPSDIDEYVHRIGRTGRVGNQGNAISYFDPAKDSSIASDLVKILSDAEQETPDWLLEFAGGGSGRGRGALYGAAKDIRRGLNFVNQETEYSAAPLLGGPSNNVVDEEWDE